MRGVRGAITVEEDRKEAIWSAAATLVETMLRENGIAPETIGAAIFSATEDLVSAFPSAGVRARVAGFDAVPLFDARQLAIEGSLPHCIRVLLLVDTEKGQKDMQSCGRISQARERTLRARWERCRKGSSGEAPLPEIWRGSARLEFPLYFFTRLMYDKKVEYFCIQ